MTDKEKLIEEAAKAIRDADNDFDFNEFGIKDRDERWLRSLASAALAVFEKWEGRVGPCWDRGPQMLVPKGQCAPERPLCELPAGHAGAHVGGSATWRRWPPERITPTDDERKALLDEADALVASWDQKGSWSSDSPVGMVMRLAAALRRSEVPETSAEPKHDESCAEWCNHCQVCGEGIRYGSRCREHYQNQPQGEPSDAQVEAGCVAFYEDATGLTSWRRLVEFDAVLAERYRNGIRRALRAAGGVR